MNGRLALSRYSKRALHVAGAFIAGEPDLLRSGAHALQGAVQHGNAARTRDDASKRRRLIESPRPEPAPVQGDRNERVRVGEQGPAGLGHPPAHGRSEIEPVVILEGMNESAGDIIKANGGAGASIGGWIGDRLHREDAGTRIVDEGDAEPFAIGRGDERQLRPARSAQAAWASHKFATSRTQRRK